MSMFVDSLGTDFYASGLNLPVRVSLDLLSYFGLKLCGVIGLTLVQLLYLICGLVFIRGSAKDRSEWWLAVVSAGVVFALVPYHLFAISGIGSTLFVTGCLIAAGRSPSRYRKSIWYLLASNAAFFFGPFTPFLFLLWALVSLQRSAGSRVAQFLFFAALVSVLALPVFQMPNYPEGARLIPFSSRMFLSDPIVGPVLQPNPVISAALRSLAREELIRLLFLPLILGAIFGRRLSVPTLLVAFASAITFVAGELLFPLSNVGDAPFQALVRYIPGVALLPCVGIVATAFILVGAISIDKASFHRGAFAGFLALALVAGTLQSDLLHQLFSNERPLKDVFVVQVQNDVDRARIVSGAVEKVFGEQIFSADPADHFRFQHAYQTGEDFTAQLTAQPNSGDAILALDQDPNTRWRTARSQQAGDLLEIVLDRPLLIHGVELQNLQAPADYPRGIRVECSNDGRSYQNVFEAPDWIGSLEYTDAGLPYFGSQSSVRIPFPSPLECQIIRLTQIGSEPVFDWSVGEAILFKADLRKEAGNP